MIPVKKDHRFYLRLFWSTFTLSACTFGGGYVIIPLMRRKFVIQLGWMEEREMLDIAAIAQSAPGAMAVNAAILVGYRLAGIPGALLTILGTVLPPLALLSVISLCYTAFRDSGLVAAFLWGMQAAVGAVIADVVISMGMQIARLKKALPICIMLGSFTAAIVFGVNAVWIILFCGALGALSTLWRNRGTRRAKAPRKEDDV